MTDEEIKKLIFVVKSAYPNHYAHFSDADFETLHATWKMCLGEYPYELASNGIKAFLVSDTKGFPPVVGQIIEQMNKLNPSTQIMGELEAWNIVYRAICNSAYNSEQEFSKLPPLCQKVLGNASSLKEMATMDADTVKSVEQSHFIRQYREYANREKEQMMLPPSMRIGQQERVMIE